MIDIVEVLQHWHAGRPKSVVAVSLGIDPKTVRKYVAPAEAAGLAPGGPVLSRAEWAELVRGWFPELVDGRARSRLFGVIDAHRERIADMLKTNTVTTVHQRMRDEHGLAVGISSFRLYVADVFPDEANRDRVTVLRPDVAPGEEAQIDYGYLGTWTDPATERRRRVWAFVAALACSRHLFVRPVFTMDARSWVAAHVAALAFFGGCPRRLVPDNLATGVDRPDIYDPKVNRAYGELAAHYGCLIDPARRGKPKDKPRVERPIPYVRDSMWRGREWRDLDDMQAGALRWCVEVAGRRAHRSLDGASPLAVFEAVEAAGPLSAAGGAVRAGVVVGAQGRTRLPHPGRQDVVLGAVAPHWPPRRRPRGRAHRRGLRRRQPGQDVGPGRARQADRLGRLPAREGDVLHAHADLVPTQGR